MQINVKVMSEEAYKTLQRNYKDVYKEILKHPSDCTWLKDYLGFEPFEEKKYVIDDFTMKYSENYSEVAFDNAVVLYNALCNLPRYILCNNRFWAWVLFEKFYKQAQKAIPLTESVIRTRWLIDTSRRNLMLGVVSRQYFKVEIVQGDEDQDNKLAKFIIENHNPYKNLTMRNIGMLKNVAIPYVKICKESFEAGQTLHDEFCSSLMKEASRLGSVMLIDMVSEDYIYSYLKSKLNKIENNSNS